MLNVSYNIHYVQSDSLAMQLILNFAAFDLLS